MIQDLRHLEDAELLQRLRSIVLQARRSLATELCHIGEVEARKLHLGLGYSSMHAYCTRTLGYSESAAFRRITVARLLRRFPPIGEYVADGTLHLTALTMLGTTLTQENHREMLARARGKTKRELAEMLADLQPKPDKPARIRRLPQRRPERTQLQLAPQAASSPASPPPRATRPTSPARTPSARQEPLGRGRYQLSFCADAALVGTLERVRALLSHRVPSGDLETIVGLALRELCESLEKKRFRSCKKTAKNTAARHSTAESSTISQAAVASRSARQLPGSAARAGASGKVAAAARATSESAREEAGEATRAGASDTSRYIAKEVRDAVWERDGGRCAFVSEDGRRCCETRWLEWHHVIPFARGGQATLENLTLYCRAHNQYQGRLDFGGSTPRRSTHGLNKPSASWGSQFPDGNM